MSKLNPGDKVRFKDHPNGPTGVIRDHHARKTRGFSAKEVDENGWVLVVWDRDGSVDAYLPSQLEKVNDG